MDLGSFWYVWVLPILGGIIWYFISKSAVRAPGAMLQKKFVSLNPLAGKTYSEIAAKCGAPNSLSSQVLDDGTVVKIYQWMATGYHIVLLFDQNDICLGISSETSV